MFALMMHSTHFIYGYMVLEIGKGPFIYRERKPAATTWATLSDKQQGFFYMHNPRQNNTYHGFFVEQQSWNTGWNEK